MRIDLKIDRFENEKAVLKTNDGENISWPKDNLPENIKEGDMISFFISRNLNEADNKKSLAKNILNELLDTD